MKSNKGITLTSLIVYLIVFIMIIGTVSSISGYFSENNDEMIILSNFSEQYITFTSYLTGDLNSIDFKNIFVRDNMITINFINEDRHIYIYDENKVYFVIEQGFKITSTITICYNINECNFIYENNILKINMKMNDLIYNNYYSI